jgi:hypothetical protein
MSNETVNRSLKNLKVSEYVPGIVKASRKTRWLVSTSSPKCADDLTFTSRDQKGCIRWWDVVVPKTNYWHVHHSLGRAYAFEVLDFLNNPEAQDVNGGELGFICTAIARWLPTVAGSAATGIADGFFGVISEFVSTGTADR